MSENNLPKDSDSYGCGACLFWLALKPVWWFWLAPLIVEAFSMTPQQELVIKLLGVFFL